MNREIVNENVRELKRTLKNLRNERSDIEDDIKEHERMRHEIYEYLMDLEKQLINANGN